MPFLKDFIINHKTKIILWKIMPGELDDKHLSEEDKSLLKKRKGKNLREYFLAVRKILKNENPELSIKYDLNGKPHLNNQKGISISHSNEIVAVGISNEIDFGIDIQHKTDKIFKIKNKFLSINESKFMGKTDDLELLIKLWSAKESIFTDIETNEIENFSDQNINQLKILLANKTTEMLHGKKESLKSEKIAKEAFSDNSSGSSLPSIKLSKRILNENINIIDLIVLAKFEQSKSEVRRLIKGKAVKINNQIIEDEKFIISDKIFKDNYVKLSIGKKRHIRIQLS